MAWINVIGPDQADDQLQQRYDEAIRRAGRVWNIVSIMSQNPAVLKGSMEFYRAIMFCRSPLSRGQREMLATVVNPSHFLFQLHQPNRGRVVG